MLILSSINCTTGRKWSKKMHPYLSIVTLGLEVEPIFGNSKLMRFLELMLEQFLGGVYCISTSSQKKGWFYGK